MFKHHVACYDCQWVVLPQTVSASSCGNLHSLTEPSGVINLEYCIKCSDHRGQNLQRLLEGTEVSWQLQHF
jgi:hypothetical protein